MPLTPTLTPEDLATLSRLLDDGLELPAGQVDAWLAGLPPEQAHLAPRLGAMLAARLSPSGIGFLADGPQLEPAADATATHAGDRVGPYRLVRELGHGGMGAVWLADRIDGGFKRQVALKLPRLAWGDGLAERMARERDIGALLEHANIARLYDAGVDEHGRPYLAFEFVDGTPLDAWCAQRQLPVRDRLALFLQVARAVAYAHGRLVVHRDLKPSNVLVTREGQAVLLDFGIAKLLDDTVGGDGLTQQHGRVLTPHYAPPEQIRGESITVQSDVYSLGAMLFELLTAHHPYEPERPTVAAIDAAMREGEAAAPSSRAPDAATARALRGELDAIIGKALRLAPSARYATADAMADDVQRHLDGDRVLAQPDSRLLRARKALRRHWMAFSAAAVVLLAVVGGSLGVAVQAQRAARADARERVIKDFVADMFRINGGLAQQASDPSGRQALVQDGARLINTRFQDQPALQAELYGIAGGVFTDMGAHRLAADYARRRGEALARSGADAHQQARAALTLAYAMFNDDKLAEALAGARAALTQPGADRSLVADGLVLQARAEIELGKLADAVRSLDRVDALQAGANGKPSAAVAWARAARARMLVIGNHQDDAIPVYDEAIALALAAEGPRSLSAVAIRLVIANTLAETVTFAARAQQFFEPAEGALRQLGGAHAIRAAYESARFAALRNQLVDVEPPMTTLAVLERNRAELAAAAAVIPAWFIPQVDYWIGVIKVNNGDIAGGLALLEANVPLLLEAIESPNRRRRILTFHGRTLMNAGRHDEARTYLGEALEARRRSGLGNHPWAAVNYADVANNELMQGRIADADGVLDGAPQFAPLRGEGLNPARYGRMLVWVRARVRLAAGEPEAALRLLQSSAPDKGESEDEVKNWRAAMGESLCAVGRRAEGLRVLGEQLRADDAAIAARPGDPVAARMATSPSIARRRAVAGLCSLANGDRDTARRLALAARAAFVAQPGVSDWFKAPADRLERLLAAR